jgi:HlyD family secretion protein
VILDRRDRVTALSESLIQFAQGKPFVEVETAPQKFAKRALKLGLSDGLYVEVIAGLSPKDKVKVFQATENGHKGR